jgi:GNAT superfamily N-acetyltransferase
LKELKFIQLQKDNEEYYNLLAGLMIPYNKELDEHKGSRTPKDTLLKVIRSMLNLQGPQDRHLELCYEGEYLIGFLYVKVDHENHKGFIKPEYGYIMEFYVKPEYRRKGYGKAIFNRIEVLFASHGTKRMYLTADSVTGIPFWAAMGFENTGETSPENGQLIYEKNL